MPDEGERQRAKQRSLERHPLAPQDAARIVCLVHTVSDGSPAVDLPPDFTKLDGDLSSSMANAEAVCRNRFALLKGATAAVASERSNQNGDELIGSAGLDSATRWRAACLATSQSRRPPMHSFDPMGTEQKECCDTHYSFDPTDTEALTKAEERFRALTGAGFTAARRKDGQAQLVRSFDPSADETLFFPRLQGG